MSLTRPRPPSAPHIPCVRAPYQDNERVSAPRTPYDDDDDERQLSDTAELLRALAEEDEQALGLELPLLQLRRLVALARAAPDEGRRLIEHNGPAIIVNAALRARQQHAQRDKATQLQRWAAYLLAILAAGLPTLRFELAKPIAGLMRGLPDDAYVQAACSSGLGSVAGGGDAERTEVLLLSGPELVVDSMRRFEESKLHSSTQTPAVPSVPAGQGGLGVAAATLSTCGVEVASARPQDGPYTSAGQPVPNTSSQGARHLVPSEAGTERLCLPPADPATDSKASACASDSSTWAFHHVPPEPDAERPSAPLQMPRLPPAPLAADLATPASASDPNTWVLHHLPPESDVERPSAPPPMPRPKAAPPNTSAVLCTSNTHGPCSGITSADSSQTLGDAGHANRQHTWQQGCDGEPFDSSMCYAQAEPECLAGDGSSKEDVLNLQLMGAWALGVLASEPKGRREVLRHEGHVRIVAALNSQLATSRHEDDDGAAEVVGVNVQDASHTFDVGTTVVKAQLATIGPWAIATLAYGEDESTRRAHVLKLVQASCPAAVILAMDTFPWLAALHLQALTALGLMGPFIAFTRAFENERAEERLEFGAAKDTANDFRRFKDSGSHGLDDRHPSEQDLGFISALSSYPAMANAISSTMVRLISNRDVVELGCWALASAIDANPTIGAAWSAQECSQVAIAVVGVMRRHSRSIGLQVHASWCIGVLAEASSIGRRSAVDADAIVVIEEALDRFNPTNAEAAPSDATPRSFFPTVRDAKSAVLTNHNTNAAHSVGTFYALRASSLGHSTRSQTYSSRGPSEWPAAYEQLDKVARWALYELALPAEFRKTWRCLEKCAATCARPNCLSTNAPAFDHYHFNFFKWIISGSWSAKPQQ